MVKTRSNTSTCTGRHPMADSSLTDPARTTHPGQLWTNAYMLTQCISVSSKYNVLGTSPTSHVCVHPLTESVCVQSNTSGRQTSCTSAHQQCGRSNTEKELQTYYSELRQIIKVISIQKLPDRNRGGPRHPWTAS